MRAILKKTISPNFRAGDVLSGDNARIKNLASKNIAVLDSSLLSYTAIWFSIVTNILWIGFLVFLSIPISSHYLNFSLPLIWRVVLLIIAINSILLNVAYFRNVKAPYVSFVLMFLLNPIAGIMFLVGHEKMAASYNPKTMTIAADMFVSILVILASTTALLALLDSIYILYPDIPGFSNTWMFTLWIAFIIVGVLGSIAFDIDYMKRRKRFIMFITKQNTRIEYRTKALNNYRSYLNTGNSEKLLKNNAEIMSDALHENRLEIKKT